MSTFKKNPQGFTIINLSHENVKFAQQIDAAFQFEFHGYDISISTGGSVLSGGCLVEHQITRPDGTRFMCRGSVQDAITEVLNEINTSEVM